MATVNLLSAPLEDLKDTRNAECSAPVQTESESLNNGEVLWHSGSWQQEFAPAGHGISPETLSCVLDVGTAIEQSLETLLSADIAANTCVTGIQADDLRKEVSGQSSDPKKELDTIAVPDPSLAATDKFQCLICSCAFLSSEQLELHARRAYHRTYVCPEIGCGKGFCRRDSSIRHKKVHRAPSDVYACQLCALEGRAKVFKRKDHLNKHLERCRSTASFLPELAPLPAQCAFPELLPGDCSLPTPPSWDPTGPRPVSPINTDSESESYWGRRAPSEYQSRAVLEVESALRSFVGQDTRAMRFMKDRLDLKPQATTEQLAKRLTGILLTEMSVEEQHVLESPTPAKRRKDSLN